jgi:16S rRNA (guanine(966)-N(2))-methyltransferase RsmD
MMDKVRQAVFNSVLSWAGSVNVVPPGSRWLDLFAGTGSVGLEALSRGAEECHFVEMDPWVIRKILSKNISTCGFNKKAITHTSKAEEFLRRAKDLPMYAGGAFDFISMCPPYLLVSYPELYDLLEGSPLVHEGTIVFVEFPKQLMGQMRDRIGPLHKVREKSYGRTWVATYAATSDGHADGDDGDMMEVSALLSA